MEAVLGDCGRNPQIPFLGDQTGQVEFIGEAHTDDAVSSIEGRHTLRTERAVIEAAAIAQAGPIGAEAQSRHEDEVQTDLGREQLGGGEQLDALGRFADAPASLGFEARHRARDLCEDEGFADLRDDG